MKKSEVPQDESFLSKQNVTEIYYALDEEGKFSTQKSKGWEVKTLVQTETLNSLHQRALVAKDAVANGQKSPIVYFMEVNKMDWKTLAAYMDTFTFLIKRHQKPSVFKKIKPKTLAKYAKIFNITVEELTSFDGK
ncbi:hypothetical protein ACF3NR_03715 [Vaginella massiliensis]|uniref:hypothetical protein n=1 Tax=Vaginella massiliensis TaxID=1816680 RepID=UPI000838D28E|nr:hypothetical protein [Vaginella massiliensis]